MPHMGDQIQVYDLLNDIQYFAITTFNKGVGQKEYEYRNVLEDIHRRATAALKVLDDMKREQLNNEYRKIKEEE